tara:strand:- start:23528 stop:23914 length:387 start_codon:yes stop_codon:yes gene_type:complete
MLQHIKALLLDKAIYFAILITIIIALLSLLNLNNVDIPIGSSDKIGHTIAYFSLTVSWLYTFVRKQNFNKFARYSIVGCFIYGIVIEVLQTTITSYRTASYLDILANSAGIVLAILVFHLLEKKIRLI